MEKQKNREKQSVELSQDPHPGGEGDVPWLHYSKGTSPMSGKATGIEIDKRNFSITNPIKHTGDPSLHQTARRSTAKLRVIVEVYEEVL